MLCCICYITCNVSYRYITFFFLLCYKHYLMLYNMLSNFMLCYNMLCYICYITCNVMLGLCYVIEHVMLYNMLFYVKLYNMLCYVI